MTTRPLLNILAPEHCLVYQKYKGMSYEERYRMPIPLDGCPVCYWCHPFIESNKKFVKDSPKNKSVQNTQFAFTLTQPPGYVKPGGMSIEESARKLLQHGLTSKPEQKANKWAYVLEHTEQGTPHVHGVYSTESGKKIGDKYFKRYWPLWDTKRRMGQGHQGGYHAQARHNESYENYLTKEGCVQSSVDILPDLKSEP
jgi:hypothetical protein